MEVQDSLKKGKTIQASTLAYKKGISVINTSSQSLSTSVLHETTLSTTDVENESYLEDNETTVNIDSKNGLSSPQTSSSTENGPTNNLSTINMNSSSDLPFSTDTTSTAHSNITSSNQTNTPISDENVPASVRTNFKREFDDQEDCMIIDKPVSKKPKIEPINSETFSFDQPSAATLKEMCKKLNVKYCNEAYKFWGDIIFENNFKTTANK
uniref:Uncharacterized protein n=1 Tax=Panagrolaimus davidi TaxID=227884 RepID=A0A914PGS5_9BILA